MHWGWKVGRERRWAGGCVRRHFDEFPFWACLPPGSSTRAWELVEAKGRDNQGNKGWCCNHLSQGSLSLVQGKCQGLGVAGQGRRIQPPSFLVLVQDCTPEAAHTSPGQGGRGLSRHLWRWESLTPERAGVRGNEKARSSLLYCQTLSKGHPHAHPCAAHSWCS